MHCEVVINGLTKADWERCAEEFSDYNIYQTWGYQQVRTENDRQKLCQIQVKNGCSSAAAMCQMRVKKLYPLGLKIGYIQWGPLFCTRGGQNNCTAEILMELKESLFRKEVNILRIVPNIVNDNFGQKIIEMFEDAGFECVKGIQPYQTMLLSLEESEEDLRKRLHQGWRRKLKKAENAGIVIKENEDFESAFDILKNYYGRIVKKKNINGLDVQLFAKSQKLLSPREKLHVIVAYWQGEPVAVHVTSVSGETAILLLVACNEKGYQCGASYIVWWNSIMACKSRGLKKYDVGGIDFENNPSVSRFKAGLGGEECQFIGTFEVCNNSFTKLRWRFVEKSYNLIKGHA